MNENLKSAVNYCFVHPDLSMHHVAVKYGVKDSDLQRAYKEAWWNRKKAINDALTN